MAVAGTLSITNPGNTARAATRPVRKYIFAWTSDASGDVTENYSPIISGTIERVTFDPGAAAPDAAYDVTMLDEDGFDVLAGRGANLSATVTTSSKPGIAFTDGTTTSVAPISVDGKLQLVVDNAGSAKNGRVILYVR